MTSTSEESIVAATETLSVGSPNSGNGSPTTTTTTASHHPTEATTALDYVGTKKSVMKLFSLPYSNNVSVSVGIHNVEGCLLIDADPTLNESITSAAVAAVNANAVNEPSSGGGSSAIGDQETREPSQHLRQEPPTTEEELQATTSSMDIGNKSVVPLQQQSAALAAISTMIEEGRQQNKDPQSLLHQSNQAVKLFEKTSPEPRAYLPWEFSGMKMLVGSDALVYRSNTNDSSLTVRVEDAEEMRQQLLDHHQTMMEGNNKGQYQRDQTPTGTQEEEQEPGKRSYSEALRSRQLIVRQGSDQNSADTNPTPSLPGGDQQTTTCINADPSTHNISSAISADDMDGVKLYTSIVPSTNIPLGSNFSVRSEPPPDSDKLSSPIYTVIDAYLDQLITNVPQLALVLREKGFVQSVKLLQTQQIPEAFMQEKTFDTSHPFEVISTNNDAAETFDPKLMQMNAASLLNFLRANCTKDNATYLLHREAGQQNIQLFDVSAISSQRQRKWIWWLAMMSYRFSQRLRHLELTTTTTAGSSEKTVDSALQRSFRARERSLLQNTLSLLEEFNDMGGQPHEILVAEVCEKLADTFLRAEGDAAATSRPAAAEAENSASNPTPVPATSTPTLQQRYNKARPDALNKAQDHLAKGIAVLWKEWQKVMDELPCSSSSPQRSRQSQRQHPHTEDSSKGITRVVSITADTSSSDEDEEETKDGEVEALQVKAEILATRLFSLHHKIIDISLRLAELHLNAYWSSSAMQALRTAARKMADAVGICQAFRSSGYRNRAGSLGSRNQKLVLSWMHGSQLQYTRLWELCGHFARSFAADDLWRERGHAAGDDVVALLRDVESAFPWGAHTEPLLDVPTVEDIFSPYIKDLAEPTGDLYDLIGLVDTDSNLDREDIETAKKLLDGKHQLQRDRRRVLVAACFAYSRATHAYEASIKFQNWGKQEAAEAENHRVREEYALLNLLRQRQGDANNELAKLLLNELRAILAAAQDPAASSGNDKETGSAAEPLLSSALFWFMEGLKVFESCQDLRNSTLLRCNICQCYKIKANANFASSNNPQEKSNTSTSERALHADTCLKEAIGHLQAAHETMGERDVDTMTWDMVSDELAATLLVLGVRRRQALIGGGNAPVILQAMRLTPGETRSIIDPMEKALHIYEQSGNAHQAAAVHYQLALFYSKIWTCQRDETKTREMLSGAFNHYNTALAYFSKAIQGNEQTFVLLCLDLSTLYSTVSGEECLCQAFLRCLDTLDAFSKDSIAALSRPAKNQEEWLKTMTTLSASVEDRLFKTLRSLVKLEETNSSTKYKDIYRTALTTKMSAAKDSGTGDDKALLAMHTILQTVKEAYSSSSST